MALAREALGPPLRIRQPRRHRHDLRTPARPGGYHGSVADTDKVLVDACFRSWGMTTC